MYPGCRILRKVAVPVILVLAEVVLTLRVMYLLTFADHQESVSLVAKPPRELNDHPRCCVARHGLC